MTPARALLNILRNDLGFHVEARAGRLHIRPASRLTTEARELVRLARDELVLLLESEVDPDRCCWPHGVGWNSAEIARFIECSDRLQARGRCKAVAEELAQRLLYRNRRRTGPAGGGGGVGGK
jgi:hypothetical protein